MTAPLPSPPWRPSCDLHPPPLPWQYYRRARQTALHAVYPEMAVSEEHGGRMSYPRPLSEPPSPTISRSTTPAPSEIGSDDEVDEEEEVGGAGGWVETEEGTLAAGSGRSGGDWPCVSVGRERVAEFVM